MHFSRTLTVLVLVAMLSVASCREHAAGSSLGLKQLGRKLLQAGWGNPSWASTQGGTFWGPGYYVGPFAWAPGAYKDNPQLRGVNTATQRRFDMSQKK